MLAAGGRIQSLALPLPFNPPPCLVPGCDKNMPGTLIAMARLNRPSLMVYGGTIKPGYSALPGSSTTLDIVSAFQSYGEGSRRGLPGRGHGSDKPPHPIAHWFCL